jgi:signal transduction histidine kinase
METCESPGEIENASSRAPETAAALVELADTLAHRLKNPLAGIMLAASRLRKSVEKLDPEGNSPAIASQLIESVNELSRTIDHVVETVPVPAPHLVPVDLNGAVRTAAGEGIDLRLSHDLPPILTDPDLLGCVLRPLVLLGLEDRAPDAPVSLATGRKGEGGGEVELRVHLPRLDPGPEGWKALLKPFSGAGEARTLRLATAGRIAGWLGGSFTLDPAPGGGCEIRMGFPPVPGPVSD